MCEADNASFVQGTQFAKADKNQLSGLFKYLDGCLEQIVKDNELGALKQALKVATVLQAGGFLQPMLVPARLNHPPAEYLP